MLDRIFDLQAHRTTPRRELLAGATTFATMAYVVVVNPKILESAGMPFGPAMTATILTAFLGTALMGLYARRPFAVAPYMGQNVFVATSVVAALGFSWQQALGGVFLAGVLFILLTLSGVRSHLARAIPDSLKIGFAAGIGVFLAFIGLSSAGLVVPGVPGAPVLPGDLGSAPSLLAVGGMLLMGGLMIRKVPGAILIAILATTGVGLALGHGDRPERWIAAPPSVLPVLGALDIRGALSLSFLPVVATMFLMDFVDTMGTLLGVSVRAGMLDEKGELPDIGKPMLCDAAATTAGAVLGTTTSGTYLESAAGVEAGGRTGLTSVVTALLFLSCLFFAPAFGAVPGYAYGPALVLVGMTMLAPLRRLDADDLTELLPAAAPVLFTGLSFNLALGLATGLLCWPLAKLAGGRAREVPVGMWVLGGLALLFFVLYPYG